MGNNIETLNNETKIETGEQVDKAVDAQVEQGEKSLMQRFNEKHKKLGELFDKGFDSETIFAREKAEAAIEEQKSNPASDFNKHREEVAAKMGAESAEAPAMSIEDKVALASGYIADLQKMLKEAEQGPSQMAEALVGIELNKVKAEISADLDKLINEIKPIVEQEGPGHGQFTSLRGTRLNMIMDELEAMKKEFAS